MSERTAPARRLRGGSIPARLLCSASLSALALFAMPSAVHAQERDLYWDANGTATGSGGNGNWNTTGQLWSESNSDVLGPYRTWDNAALDNAIFGITAAGTTTTVGTVTLIEPIRVHNMTFQTVGGWVVNGNTLTLGGTTPTINTAVGTTIHSVIAGTNGLTKIGAGQLFLTGANTFSGGITLSGGGNLRVANDAALGNASNSITTTANAGLIIDTGTTNRTVAIGGSTTLSVSGAGTGSALFTGSGNISVFNGTRLTNDANTYTGTTRLNGVSQGSGSVFFSSVRNLGEASSLGAPTTVAEGTITFAGGSQYSDSIIYTGDGDSSNRNWVLSGSTLRVFRQRGTGTLTLTGNISVTPTSFVAETADFELLGVISGSGSVGFGASAAGSITLGGANSFTGNAGISGGIVRATVLADAGLVSSLGTASTISLGNLGQLSYKGSGGSSNRTWSSDGATSILNDGAGALTLGGNLSFVAGGSDTLTLGGSFAGTNRFSGILSGAGNLASSGNGTWVLDGANTRTGTVTVNGGTLRAGHASAFGTTTGITINGGTLDLNDFSLTTPTLAGTGGSVALGANPLTTLTVEGTASSSYGGDITGAGGLAKLGTGTLTLSGANSYTGATTVGGGTLRLDFSPAGGPASDIISASSSLNMSGGTLAIVGAAGEANIQTFGGLNVTAGANMISGASGSGGSLTVNLGAINRTGGIVNFNLPTNGSFTTSNISLGGWATVNGTDYAKVVGGNIIAFTDADYSDKDDASTWLNGEFISDSDGDAESYSGTVGSSIQLGGLQFTTPDATTTIAIAGGQTLGVDGTIIVAPSTLANNQAITGGNLTGLSGAGGVLGVLQNGTGTLTIGSTVVDNGAATGFTKGGQGTVSLTGANSYTGATTLGTGRLIVNSIGNGGVASAIGASSAAASNLRLAGGTLQYTGGTATTDRGFTLANDSTDTPTIQVDGSVNLSFTGQVTSPDDEGLAKTGTGTLSLDNGTNNYVGVTTISGGTLSTNALSNGGLASGIGAASAASSNIVIQSGARMQYTGGTTSTNRGFTVGTGGGRIGVTPAATALTISGTAVGTGGLAKDGDGTLILSGTNTYTGGTRVSGGTLRAGSTTAFGATNNLMTVDAATTLDLASFSNSVGALAGSGLVTLGSATLTSIGNNGTFSGAISGTGGFTKGAGGTQILSGCNNSYAGATTISGLLIVDCLANGGANSGIGASGSAASNLVFAGSMLRYTGGTVATDRGFTLQSTGQVDVNNAATTLTFTGTVTGGGQLQKHGAGTLVLTGNNNNSGGVYVDAGTLRAGSATAFGTGSYALVNRAGAVLDLNGFNMSASTLSGGGPAGGNVDLGSATLTLTGGNANYSGLITGTGNFIKSGGGFQGLLGCDSSFTGSTTISGGRLDVQCLTNGGVNSSIGSSSNGASNLVVDNAVLNYIGVGNSTNRLMTFGGSAQILSSGTGAIEFTNTGAMVFSSPNTAQTMRLGGVNTGNNRFALRLDNNGAGVTSFTKQDAGTWILTNQSSGYTGVTQILGGVLGVDKLSNGGVTSSIGQSSNAAANLIIGSGSTLRYTGTGDGTDRRFTLAVGSTFIESSGTGAVNFTNNGAISYSGSGVRVMALGGTNAGDNIMGATIGDQSATNFTSLAKNDAGKWILTGTNSYTGATNVNAGTLIIGNGGTAGSIVSGTINNAGVLGFNRADTLAIGGNILGTGSVQQLGAGVTVLTGTSSYTGGTTIAQGTLQLGNGGTTGSIVGDVVDNGLLVFNRSNLVTFAGTISGSGAVRQIGSGTTVLSGINSYAGGTSILGGTLQVSADANLGDAAGGLIFSSGTLRTTASFASARNSSLTSAGTILTDSGTIFSLGGVISGAGGLTKSGTGILTLNGSNSYAGATNVNVGTLLVNGNQSAATGLLTVASGATLGGSGTIGGSVNVLNGGILAPGNSPGTLNINGDLSLAGGSVLNFEFGQADVAGGPLNDLINVGGNLTLDGTINVNVSTGGNFGGGLYRVFNYAGVLADNGLTLGSMPAGSNVTVQTSVAGQVNLINSDGLSLSFWDGAAGPKFNNAVNGGNGSWHLGGADNNWTGADGSINAAYADGTFAIFAGAPGTVTVDNGGGAVTATGMQFATGGYTITGGPLTMVGPDSVVRVGDGTAAGAGFTATIAANVAGASRLVKTDAGTLILSGTNSYSGGTAVNGGTLRVSSDANLGDAASGVSFDNGRLQTMASFTSNRNVVLAGAGVVDTLNGSSWTIAGDITGAGSLAKTGTGGALILTGNATHAGGTTVTGTGVLQIGIGGTTGSIAGDIVVNAGTGVSFNRSDSSSYGGSITGAGVIFVDEGQLTLTGNSSVGGTINVQQNATLIINAGNTVSTGAVATVGGGTISVSGSGSAFVAQRLNALTSTGATTVNVTNGGTIRTTTGPVSLAPTGAAGPATLNVAGTGSLVDIGGALTAANGALAGTTATVTISDGGTVRSSGLNVIGSLGGNTTPSTVTITGTGSNWTSTGVLLQRNGQFSVLAGGAASFDSAQIGTIAAQGASTLVSGAGSTFTTTGELVVGSTVGSGVLTIADGGRVTADTGLMLAADTGTTGSVNIGGVEGGPAAAAGFLDGAVSFGDGDGELNFNHVEADYLFANGISGVGRINHAAGTTRLTGDSSAFTGLITVTGGTLLVDGTIGDAGSITSVAIGGTLGGTGTIGGNVSIVGGNLNPGNVGGIPGTLTITGNLSLAPAATLNVNFGQANVVGGAFNDLIEVGGSLILGGTLNVAETLGGNFEPGVYRIINYGGTLTNNGLTVDPGYFVQTSVANQVNLVNTTGLTMRFWDGVAGGKNDGAITGGDGLWQASGGNDNWTEFDGSANAPFTDGAFAVFSGLSGTVTVDDSLGAVTASGMQFASDGYVVDGDVIVLTGAQSVIRVGEGTIAGADYTATIDSAIAGASQLVKSDLGTLILTGVNSYAGGTAIKGGTLQISANSNLGDVGGGLGFDGGTLHTTADIASDRAVDLVGTGTLLTAAGTALTMSGAFSGAGGLVKTGAGTLVLRGSSSFDGNTMVDGGRLSITDGGSVSDYRGYIGSAAGQTGEVIVSGPGSNWTNANHIYVGFSGTGTLTIENGATVSNANGDVGVNAGSTGIVTVSGAGSTWTSSDDLLVGVGGEGSLTVNAGATVDNSLGSFVVGQDTGARGSVIASGAGSRITARRMFVGNYGNGELTIANGAEVSSDISWIGAVAGSQAVINIGAAAGQGPVAAGVLNTPMLTFGNGDGALVFNHTDTNYIFSAGLDSQGAGTHAIQHLAGTTILNGDGSGFTGTTTVSGGTLLVGDQSGAGSLGGSVNVALGGTLGGAGTIGGNVAIADGGALAAGVNGAGTLTINGGLSLASGSALNFEFGQANVAGGALNDLVNVGGDLVLDGTINVTVPASGNFGPGIYRVFNYGGALTNNGLDLGAMPGGSQVAVQTAVAGQVNLVNSQGVALSFWDGAIGPKNNSAVNGGDGVWQISGGLNNWTDADGTVNADYAQDSFAIFSAAPGTVTIDNSGGNVLASGMQFASDGYVLTGDALTLTGAQAIVQVGDSSAAGAGYTATIAADLTGTAGLVKTDAGTLVLTGANSYAGGTTISGGTLQVGNGGATGSIGGDIVNNAALVVDRSGTILLDGTISGTGSLTKRGGGLLELTGTNSYGGGTIIDGGTVRVFSDAGLGNVAGVLSLQGGTLQAGASFTSTRGFLLGSPDSNAIDVQGFDVTLGGVIGDGPNNGAGNFLDKRGTGTLTLTGANSYSNRTTIAGGTLALAGAGTIGAGNVIVGSGTVFDISQTTTGARVIQLGGAGTIALGSKTLTLGLGNSFTDWAGSITDGGIGGGAGGSIVVAAPNGAVRYFGATSYTGGTTVAAGSFELVGNGALHSQGAVTVNGGGQFNIAGIAAAGTTIGDLSGAGSVVLGGKTLTFGTASDMALTGMISGNGGALVKQGTGSFTLGGANSYTGATDVLAGTLLVNGNQSAATGLTSVASGATLGGTGTVGGDVNIADGATLAPGAGGAGALTINGNLALSSGATLGFEFGQANNPGGPLNDVVNLGGNLVLDGTLDVAVPVGGAFDIGLYRVINYAGSLTDDGLTLGTMPAGANAQVQTSIAGEVNLINTGSATLNFWDGAAGPKFDGAVNGGDGVWQNSLGNDNWADITGAVNAGYDDGAFAIFSGNAGTVTVDNSLGAVSASGLQFAAGGYRITGDALRLGGAQAVIRVGDGTAAGAAYVATVDAELTGAAELVKTDAGTLVLTAANSYTGGTSINGGTLQVGGDGNLGAAGGALRFDGGTLQTTASFTSSRGVELVGAGGFRTDAGTTLTLAGALSGAGSLAKSGDGTLVLDGSGAFGGATVGGGTMFVNGNYAAATGTTNVLAGATLGGTGTIGGNVAIGNGATLAPGVGAAGTLTVGGNLSLSATTQLDFEFGEASVVGGALNDLVNVGGDLVLDGVLNVGVPAGGAFDIGIYRMFNYGGALTDNGVTLGTMPVGANAAVQTSVAGQVNLVNSAGLALNFWDGAAGPKNNGTINGGNGIWQASGGNDNWTGEDGAVNAGYADGAFAIFGGTGGTVTVDNSLGAVSVVGMQFAANNYVIGGGEIALTDPTATIRVGDGSTAGAGFAATINSVLGGAAQLVKSDAGTLILGGTNSYAGGTLITGGTLRISSDANLGAASGDVTLDGGTLETSASLSSARDIIVASSGTIATAADTVFTYNGLLSGAGILTKNGAGTLLVTSDNGGFGGSTTVAGGTLAVQGSLSGAVSVGSAGRLEGTGRVGSLANGGTVAPGGDGFGTLTVSGSYSGNNGTLEIEAVLGGDASQSDRLVVAGGTSGATQVKVTNRGGLGSQTVEGIKIIDVTGGGSAGRFALNGDYLFGGEQAVIAGAYGYRLYQGGIATPTDGDWYLRSALLNGSNEPEEPLYQPGVPLYESYAATLQTLNRLGTLQQRVGNRQWSGFTQGGVGMWGRIESSRYRPEAALSTSGTDLDVDNWSLQAGFDKALLDTSAGTLIAGINGRYGKADAQVRSRFGNGSIDTRGYGVGATLTWYDSTGFYADGQAQMSWYRSDLDSTVLGKLVDDNHGSGEAFSLELGKLAPLGGGLSVTPQIQMTYSNVRFDRFTDPHGAVAAVDKGDSLRSRWGISLDHQQSWDGGSGSRQSHLYALVNLNYEWLDGSVVDVSGTPLERRDDRLWGEFGFGGSYSWAGGRFTIFSEISANTALKDFGDSNSVRGNAGFRMRF